MKGNSAGKKENGLGCLDAQQILSLVKKQCDECEVFFTAAKSVSSFVDNSKPSMAIANHETGYSVRVLEKGKVGFSSSANLGIKSVQKTVSRALFSARLSRENKGFHFLAHTKAVGRDDYDKKIDAIIENDEKKAVHAAGEYCKAAFEESNSVKIPLASFKWSAISYQLINSTGAFKEGKATFFEAEPYVIAKNAVNRAEVIEQKIMRTYSPEDLRKLARENVRTARESLDAKQVESGDYDCIFHPAETAALFEHTFGFMLSGKARLEKIAPYALGDLALDQRISIQDAQSFKGASASFPCDQEGISRKPLTVIKNGIFENEINDSYYAALLGETSSGNARRTSLSVESWYESPVSTGFNTAVFNAGNSSFAELVAETKKGIYIVRTAYPLADAVSGGFTNEIRSGFYIENGEIKHPVKSTVANGSFYDLMKNKVCGASKERETVATDTHAYCTAVASPYFKFEKIKVAGK